MLTLGELFRILESRYGPRTVAGSIGVIALILIPVTWHHNAVWESPIALFRHILDYEPKSAKVYNNYALALFAGKQWDKAEEAYRKAIAISNQYAETHHNLANLLLQRGNFRQALSEVELALKINPKLYHSWRLKGEVLIEQRQFVEARSAFDRALRIHTYDVQAWVGLAQTHDLEGNRAKAIDTLNRARQLLPRSETLQRLHRSLN